MLNNFETMNPEGARTGRGWLVATRAMVLVGVLAATVATAQASEIDGPILPVDPAEVATLRALLGVPQPAAARPVMIDQGAPSVETPAATPVPQGSEMMPTLRDGEVRGQADEVREMMVCAENAPRPASVLGGPSTFLTASAQFDRL
jgi:hypothetical protein